LHPVTSRAEAEVEVQGERTGGPPNYRKVSTKAEPDPASSCLDCKFVIDNRCRAYCVKYSTRVNPWYVCDEWKPRTA
jgi:hypothetical protein